MVGTALTPGALVDANLRQAMRTYSYATSDGESREYPGVAVASSGIRYSVFNSAMLTAAVSDENDLGQRITVALVHFAARELGWTFWICEDLIEPTVLKRMDRIFAARGMRLITAAPGMYSEELRPRSRAGAQIECRRVSDARTRFDFCDVACVVFALPFRISYQIYAEPGYWQSGTQGYVGYKNGKPVTVAAIVPAAASAGVYSLGTLPQHQRCGFGETVMRFALDDTFKTMEVTRTVLQATDSGYPLYERMGYRTVTRFRVYERAGHTA